VFGPSASMMLISFAIATAVSLLSPVIIITLIPAVLQSAMAYLTSSLTGSLIQTIPRNVPPVSRSLYLVMSISFCSIFCSFKSESLPAP
jgi:hypothetical protein